MPRAQETTFTPSSHAILFSMYSLLISILLVFQLVLIVIKFWVSQDFNKEKQIVVVVVVVVVLAPCELHEVQDPCIML
jgi:uncharacterized membrane protein